VKINSALSHRLLSMGLEGNEFAGFDQRRDGCPQDKSEQGVKRWLIEEFNN
jgi:hypothetical protein